MRVYKGVEIPDWIAQRYTYDKFPEERTIYVHKVRTPKKPPRKKIPGARKTKKNQRFEIPDQEMVWTIDAKWRNRTENGHLKEPLTEEELKFIKQQWYYRLNGYWFFNHGNLEYITGDHWFYLSYYKIRKRVEYTTHDGRKGYKRGMGLPDFTDSDRDNFLLWQEVKSNSRCAGLLEITNRRDGKSFRAEVSGFTFATNGPSTNVAVQSKNEKDAMVKVSEIVKAWKEMPAFFQPIHSGYSNPKKGIEFTAPNTFSKGEMGAVRTLDSWIKPFPSEAVQLDGYGIDFVYQDEVGKTKKVDIYDRWYVTKEALVDGTVVLGKAKLTTTVEDLESEGGQACLDLWNDSDMTKMTDDGMTDSGLWPYFKPAYYGFRGDEVVNSIDEYGYSNIEAAIDYQLGKLKNLAGPNLWRRQRKYPHTIEQAFRSAFTDNVFDSQSLFDQVDFNNRIGRSRYRVGRFVGDLEVGIEPNIRFIDDPEGPFKVSWMPDARHLNGHWPHKGRSTPVNNTVGLFGVDSFDHKKVVDNRKSKGSCVGQFDYNPLDKLLSNGLFMSYLHRPVSPYTFYEDNIRAFIFYGMQALIENQKPQFLNHMERIGADGYTMVTNRSVTTHGGSREPVDGISTAGPYIRDQLVNTMIETVLNYVGTISEETQMKELSMTKDEIERDEPGFFYFEEILDQLSKFNINDWEKFDAVVSVMLSNYGIRYRHRNDRKKAPTDNVKDFGDLFDLVDNSGDESELV